MSTIKITKVLLDVSECDIITPEGLLPMKSRILWPSEARDSTETPVRGVTGYRRIRRPEARFD